MGGRRAYFCIRMALLVEKPFSLPPGRLTEPQRLGDGKGKVWPDRVWVDW